LSKKKLIIKFLLLFEEDSQILKIVGKAIPSQPFVGATEEGYWRDF
jgi:hypothetical protein